MTKKQFFDSIVFDNVYTFKDISVIIGKGTNQVGEALKDASKWTEKRPGKGKDPFKLYGIEIHKAINAGKFNSLLNTSNIPPRPTTPISFNPLLSEMKRLERAR